MSEADRDPRADGIDEGKRLIRVAADTGLSLAERLMERFQQLTWRTPLHAMRLKGRYPLKLLAVPDDPCPGDAARGRALLEGSLSFRGETHALADLNFNRRDWGRPFAHYVHGFAWLRDLAAVAPGRDGTAIAEALTARWLDAYAEKVDALAWAPELWGRRILFWTAHAPLILSSTDLVYRSKVLHAMARGSRHLDRESDRVPPGAPRIAAWCGVVAAGLLLPGGEPRLTFGEAGLVRALQLSTFDDGGSVSRSPAMLLDSIELLAMLRAAYDARRRPLPDSVQAVQHAMVAALLGTMHGDRALSSWQGGGPSTAERVEEVVAASGVRTRPLRQARDWGYQRLASGQAVLIVDAAPPPVARAVEGGCASTLAFEFSEGPARLIVNCGGARAALATLPRAAVNGLRTTAAHSTLTVADSNSTAVHHDGTLGRGVGSVELSRQESDGASRIEASHDGYVRRFGMIHRRQLILAGDGRELRGEDALLPTGRRRRVTTVPFTVRFHLGSGIEVSPTADGQAALLRVPGGGVWQFRCRGGTLASEDSLWIDGAGRPVRTQQLVIAGEAQAGGAAVSWVLKRAR